MPRLTKEQQRENLAVAFSIIGGIPEKHFHLNQFASTDAKDAIEAAHCGTIGCTLGWLARHPYFMAQGLDLKEREPVLRYPSGRMALPSTEDAAERLFGPDAFRRYFTAYGASPKDEPLVKAAGLPSGWSFKIPSKAQHKELALARLKDGYYDPMYTESETKNANATKAN